MLELSNLCHYVQHPWKLTSREYWSSRNKRKPLSQQKCVVEEMLWGISERVIARALCKSSLLWYQGGPLAKIGSSAQVLCSGMQIISTLVHGSRSISQSRLICQVLCSGMEVISALVMGCPLAQVGSSAKFVCSYSWHFCSGTRGDFWSSRNKRKPLSKLKCVLRKCCEVISEMVNARAFKPLPLCSALLETYQ